MLVEVVDEVVFVLADTALTGSSAIIDAGDAATAADINKAMKTEHSAPSFDWKNGNLSETLSGPPVILVAFGPADDANVALGT
jgi:hypothetical protein